MVFFSDFFPLGLHAKTFLESVSLEKITIQLLAKAKAKAKAKAGQVTP